MEYIIRDHSMERFRQRIAVMNAAAEQIDRRYGKGTVTVDTQDQYYNMYEVLKDHMEIVELAEAAMKGAGIANPTHSPVRGGHRRLHADLPGAAVPQPALCRTQCPRPL